ncbi:unnamed protein product [Staurois parvus]|uniref:Uncharacterized protein n=1 Tax=Staurois parvus TaxID=386267 RepID=A0ABN9ATT9_9NEOB|nr:unnamed protein product [Staurois parvus]
MVRDCRQSTGDRDCRHTTGDGEILERFYRRWSETASILQEMVRLRSQYRNQAGTMEYDVFRN